MNKSYRIFPQIMKKYFFLSTLPIFLLLNVVFSTCSSASPFPDNPRIGASFGVQVKHDLTVDDDLARIKEAGFGFVRFDMRWGSVERGRKIYDWTAYDDFFERLDRYGLGAIVILQGGNKIYSGLVDVDPKVFWGLIQWAPAPAHEDDRAAFADFATRAAQRYHRRGVIWEIWNEPDAGGFWAPGPDPAAYTRLATTACQTMRATVPDVSVIGPALAMLPRPFPPRRTFIRNFLQSPGLSCFDAISLHPYRDKDQVPESVIEDYATVRAYMDKQLPNGESLPPIVNSEWGYSVTDVSENLQADYVLRSHLSNLLGGGRLSVWYEWRNSRNDQPGDRQAHYGLLYNKRDAKPSLEALNALLPVIRDATIEKRIDTGNDDIFVVALKYPDGRRAVLFWSATKENTGIELTMSWPEQTKAMNVTTRPQLVETAQAIPVVSIDSGGTGTDE